MPTDPLEDNPPPEHLEHLSETLLLWLLKQCDGDWSRVTLDQNDVPTVHNNPQPPPEPPKPPIVRIELPPQGATAKRLGIRSRSLAPRRSSTAPAAAAQAPPPAPVRTRNWHDDEWVWDPVVRDPRTRSLGKLVVKVDQGEEIEPEEPAVEASRPTPGPPVFAAPPPTPPADARPAPVPAPPKPSAAAAAPAAAPANGRAAAPAFRSLDQTPGAGFPSLDEARTAARSGSAAGGNGPAPRSPAMSAGSSGVGGNGPAPRSAREPAAKVPEDETLRRPRTLRQRLTELGAEVRVSDDGKRALVTYRGYDIGSYKVKGFTPGSLRNSWAELSAKIERMR